MYSFLSRMRTNTRATSKTASNVPLKTPTTDLDLQEVEVILDRLASETRRAVARLGQDGAGARSLARVIDADVALCHRVLAGTRAHGSLTERLIAWPGASGVRTIATKLCIAAGKDQLGGPLRLAVDAYAELVQSAGTQAKLVRAVRASESGGGERATVNAAEQLAARRTLTRGASQTMGYSVQLCTFVSFMRPIPGSPELLEGCSAWGLLGVQSHGSRIHITSQNTQMRGNAGNLAQEVGWRSLGTPVDSRDGLLTEFSSNPVPITASDDGDGYRRQMIEPEWLRSNGSADVVLARHWSPDNNPQYVAPLHGEAPVWSQIVRVRHPAQRLIFDVYLHRSMLGNAPPVISAYFWHPALTNDPRRQWHDRLPGSPRIEILPLSPQEPTTDAWDRQPELTSRLRELVGWSSDEFIGFRCDERFPLWSAAYYMTFELAHIRSQRPNDSM